MDTNYSIEIAENGDVAEAFGLSKERSEELNELTDHIDENSVEFSDGRAELKFSKLVREYTALAKTQQEQGYLLLLAGRSIEHIHNVLLLHGGVVCECGEDH